MSNYLIELHSHVYSKTAYFIGPDIKFFVQLIKIRNIELSKHFSCLPHDLQYM